MELEIGSRHGKSNILVIFKSFQLYNIYEYIIRKNESCLDIPDAMVSPGRTLHSSLNFIHILPRHKEMIKFKQYLVNKPYPQ